MFLFLNYVRISKLIHDFQTLLKSAKENRSHFFTSIVGNFGAKKNKQIYRCTLYLNNGTAIRPYSVASSCGWRPGYSMSVGVIDSVMCVFCILVIFTFARYEPARLRELWALLLLLDTRERPKWALQVGYYLSEAQPLQSPVVERSWQWWRSRKSAKSKHNW